MANAENHAHGHDAPGNSAPPTRQPTVSSTRGAAELPGDSPETSTPSNRQEGQAGVPEQSRSKPEGSAYASSYRPAETPASPSPMTNADERAGYHNSSAHNYNHDHDDYHDPTLPPPAYSETPGQITDDSSDLGTNAVVANDGRVNIRINQKSRQLSQIFHPQIQRQLTQIELEAPLPPPYVPEFLGGAPGQEPPPSLNVVIHVVGSRGDVQPFVALGKVLKETYKHRVRLATHPTFKDFVTENGLEFFSISGDPAELMAFMVKNPGLMPGFETLRSGDVGKRRKEIAGILRGTWRSCIETGDGMSVDPLKQTVEEWMGAEQHIAEELKKPFVADAIIANPPSFGHIHCAEKLGIPLHMMFTMPYSPTQQFPHPLANIQASNADPSITNYISYTLVEMLTWQGLGDLINRFRKDSLGLDPISMIWAPGMLHRLKIPYTYCWSPALIPKPKDWASHISIAGFYFLSLASNYTPAPDLAAFLDAGEPPVYIGFGSIVVDDPNAMTQMIFEAVKKTGRRALVSKGWGGLGADEFGIPEGVFMLGNVPHDWLFKKVAAVVHHGGAGTTAAGIAAGRPTVVVPFFGDQQFWGSMTAKAGAGPVPIPYKDLTADKLAEAINEALTPQSLERAQELANRISQEQGCQNGTQSFHQMLKYDELRCAVAPKNPAVWRIKRTKVRLSAMAATILAQEGELNFSELKLFRPREYETDEGPWDPISGGATAIIGTATTMMMGVADFPIETLKLLNIHPDTKKEKGKGKGKANGSGSDASSRTGRTQESKPTTNAQASAMSSSSTLVGAQTSRSPADNVPGTPTGSDFTQVASPIRPSSPATPNHRSAFMAQAMAASSEVSRSPSRDRHLRCPSGDLFQRGGRSKSVSQADLRSDSGQTTFSDRLHAMNTDAAIGTGKGLGRIIGAGFKSPMDFSLNISKGFHNLPKLYGGEVRQVDKVTDLQSGMRTAVKELGLGMYDSISGLVTDPYKGAKKEGAAGFIKGVGRGIAGVPIKFGSGLFALPGYAMKGLYQEALKHKGANVQNYIIAARISQGYNEASSVSAHERADIVSRWKRIKTNIKKKKNVGEEQIELLQKAVQQKCARQHDGWSRINSHFKRPEARPSFPENAHESSGHGHSPATTRHETSPEPRSYRHLAHANTFPRSHTAAFSQSEPTLPGREQEALTAEEEEAERRELEAAIAASISENSLGSAEEDDMIARAVRASIAELQRPVPEGEHEDDEHALQRAITASIEEASKHGASEDDQKMLEEALRKSMLETRGRHVRGSDSEWDSDSDTEEDAEYLRIIAESKESPHMRIYPDAYRGHSADGPQDSGVVAGNEDSGDAKTNQHDEDAEFKRILAESEKAERDRMAELEKQKTEEEIVMEYVKKQSVMEEEHRRRRAEGRDTAGEGSGAAR